MPVHRHPTVPVTVLALLLVSGAAHAAGIGQFNAGERFRMGPDELHVGDLYVAAADTRVDGTLRGDLVVWSASTRVDGEVTGDLIVGASQVDIAGTVGDTVRVFAGQLSVSGHVDGDLLAFAGDVTVTETGHVTGNVIVCSGRVRIDGTVDGRLRLTAGQVIVDGPIGGDAWIEADVVELRDNARIAGNLTHTSREFDRSAGAEVLGETTFEKKIDEHEDDDDSGTFGLLWWLWTTSAAMLTGLALIALFRGFVPALTTTLDRETVMGGLVGFGAFLVVPAASFLAILLLFTLPLGMVGLLLFLVAVYVAKLPVATWIGRKLLSLLGSADPSPYLAMLVGLPVLYLLFLIPYLGKLVWLVAVWLGLGTIILATRARLQTPAADPAAAS